MQALKMTNFNILITSDIVCPWCYIGHTRLTRAINNHKASYPDDTFSLSYVPFYLNPPSRSEGTFFPSGSSSIDRKKYYASKFGPDRAEQIFRTLGQVAKGEGLDFKFGGKTGSSRNGHRLVQYAKTHGGESAQNETMLGLWRRYFEQEVDITQLDVLVETGVEAGLGNAEELKKYLESDEGCKVVDKEAQEAREKGINGVPNYEIQDEYEVSGAQDPVAFERLFKRWKDREEKL